MIGEKKIEEIKERMKNLGIKEVDLKENFILGSGRGGQNLQKTHSLVQLTHLPSGMQVRCGVSRQREENRWLARRQLCEKLYEAQNPKDSPSHKNREKVRKQKKKAYRRSAEKHQQNLPEE